MSIYESQKLASNPQEDKEDFQLNLMPK